MQKGWWYVSLSQFCILKRTQPNPVKMKKKRKCWICDWNSKFSMFQFMCGFFGKIFCVYSFSVVDSGLFYEYMSVYICSGICAVGDGLVKPMEWILFCQIVNGKHKNRLFFCYGRMVLRVGLTTAPPKTDGGGCCDLSMDVYLSNVRGFLGA